MSTWYAAYVVGAMLQLFSNMFSKSQKATRARIAPT